jgi:tetratricopeptide (TPR) repeat protein
MPDNFCKKCGNAVEPEDRFCPICGAALTEPIAQPPVAVKTTAKPRQGKGCITIFILLIIAIVGYSIYGILADRSNYAKGHQAYQEGNCAAAIEYYNRILKGWRIIENERYLSAASPEFAFCASFQDAVDRQIAGDYSEALSRFMDFSDKNPDNVLAGYARQKMKAIFEQVQPAELANYTTCNDPKNLRTEDILPQQAAPAFFLACGKFYDASEIDQSKSIDLYIAILQEYPGNAAVPAAEAALLAHVSACYYTEEMELVLKPATRENNLPGLYYRCGQSTDDKGRTAWLYKTLLMNYPNSAIAPEVETALLAILSANSDICDFYFDYNGDIVDSVLANRKGLMPKLYYACGQAYESSGDWYSAVDMYQGCLADFPADPNASLVEVALARSIIAKVKTAHTFEKTIPDASGSTGDESTVIVFQNDSPEVLRIVFSGPEIHVEELAACISCTTYTGVGPMTCPESGPVGRYTLKPGQYEVVVEAKYGGVIPWLGNWSFLTGSEYSTCFFVVTGN